MSKAIEDSDMNTSHHFRLGILDGITALLKKGTAVEVDDILEFIGSSRNSRISATTAKRKGSSSALSRRDFRKKGYNRSDARGARPGTRIDQTMKGAVEKPRFPEIHTSRRGVFELAAESYPEREHCPVPGGREPLTAPSLKKYTNPSRTRRKGDRTGAARAIHELLKGLQRKYAASETAWCII